MTEQRSAWLLQGEEVKEPLHYPECGLDDVYLLNGYEHVETAYGHGIAVKSLEELREAIALRLVRRKKVLSGKEVRFLRKQLDLTQADLGKLLGMDSQTVARWEKGQNKVNGAADRVLRLLSVEHMTNPIPFRVLLERLDELDALANDRQVFEVTDGGWKPIAA